MIVIDTASPTPPYEQLRAQLARQIQDRSLAVGTRLPTIRRLAADLGLGARRHAVVSAAAACPAAGPCDRRLRARPRLTAGDDRRAAPHAARVAEAGTPHALRSGAASPGRISIR